MKMKHIAKTIMTRFGKLATALTGTGFVLLLVKLLDFLGALDMFHTHKESILAVLSSPYTPTICFVLAIFALWRAGKQAEKGYNESGERLLREQKKYADFSVQLINSLEMTLELDALRYLIEEMETRLISYEHKFNVYISDKNENVMREHEFYQQMPIQQINQNFSLLPLDSKIDSFRKKKPSLDLCNAGHSMDSQIHEFNPTTNEDYIRTQKINIGICHIYIQSLKSEHDAFTQKRTQMVRSIATSDLALRIEHK